MPPIASVGLPFLFQGVEVLPAPIEEKLVRVGVLLQRRVEGGLLTLEGVVATK